MSNETDIFDATYTAITWGRCKMRAGSSIIDKATSSGIELGNSIDGSTQYDQVSGTVRYLKVDEIAGRCNRGSLIEVKMDGGEWIEAMITAKHEHGGVVRVQLESPAQ